MFLDAPDLVTLTGWRSAKKQIAWLVERRYPFELNAAGKPRVLRTFVERKLGGGMAPALTRTQTKEPNFKPRLKKAA